MQGRAGFAVGLFLLSACVVVNPAFDETRGTGGGSAAGEGTNPGALTFDTTFATDGSGSRTSDATKTSGASVSVDSSGQDVDTSTSAGEQGSSSGEDAGMACEDISGFAMSFEHEACEGEGSFAHVETCTSRSAVGGFGEDTIGVRPGIACNSGVAACGWGNNDPVIPLTVSGVPFRDAILDGNRCGPLWVVGTSNDGGCRFDGFVLFGDDPGHELVAGFWNVGAEEGTLVEFLDGLTTFETPVVDGRVCGPPQTQCPEGVGALAVELGTAYVLPGDPPVDTEIRFAGPGGLVTQHVHVFNFGLHRDGNCRTRGSWAVVSSDHTALIEALSDP